MFSLAMTQRYITRHPPLKKSQENENDDVVFVVVLMYVSCQLIILSTTGGQSTGNVMFVQKDPVSFFGCVVVQYSTVQYSTVNERMDGWTDEWQSKRCARAGAWLTVFCVCVACRRPRPQTSSTCFWSSLLLLGLELLLALLRLAAARHHTGGKRHKNNRTTPCYCCCCCCWCCCLSSPGRLVGCGRFRLFLSFFLSCLPPFAKWPRPNPIQQVLTLCTTSTTITR
jgi:hypothetical protein